MNQDGFKLTSYFGERQRAGGGFAAGALLDLYGRHQIATSILLRGAEGFGIARHPRTDRSLTLSEDLPLIGVAVDSRPRIEEVLEPTGRILGAGLVTLERARLLSGDIEAIALRDAVHEETKLTIYLGRQERVYRVPAFVAVCDLLRRRGVAGATALLGVDGTAHGRRERASFFSRNAGTPMMVIAVGSGERIGRVLPELGGLLRRPLLTLERVRICKRDGKLLCTPSALPGSDETGMPLWHKLMVYTSEAALHNGQPIHRAIMRELRAAGISGATTQRGVWGFHGDHAPHGDRLLQLGRHVPAISVVIDAPERIVAAFSVIDELTSEQGLVTSELVPAVRVGRGGPLAGAAPFRLRIRSGQAASRTMKSGDGARRIRPPWLMAPGDCLAAGNTGSQDVTRPNGRGGPHPSLLFAGARAAGEAGEPGDDRSYARDLNLDQVVAAIAGDREERALITEILFGRLRDADAVRYRQEVFRDLDDPALLTEIRRFADQMTEVRAHLRQLESMRYRYQREAWFLDAAAIYCEAVRSLAAHLASALLGSRALLAFRDYLTRYAASAGFAALARDTQDRSDALGRIRYCTRIRGDRVEVTRYAGEADYSAVVLKTFERFQQGAVRDYRVRYRMGPGMNHIAARILDLVARLFPEEFAALDEYSCAHAAFLDEGIGQAHRELQFYLAYLDYIGPVRAAGLSFCYPEVSANSKEVHAAAAFDLALARKLAANGTPVVTNDFRLDGRERIAVVTGPNQGGKTTYARTFGQLHHLAAVGCPVPGSTARLFLCDRIFTHFEQAEDLATMRGKLEDDLVRIGGILRAATPDSILILNETFASTTTRDARFLGTKLLTKVMRVDALCVYVTFVDELASLGGQVVSMMSTVVPHNPAERTFKVVRKPADGLAHALAIAEKYDLTYHRLRGRIAP